MVKPLEYEASVPITQQAMPTKATTFEAAGSLFGEVRKDTLKIARKRKHDELLSQQYMIDGDLSETTNKILNKALQNPDAHAGLEEFNTQIHEYVNKTLETTPNKIKPNIQENAIRYITAAHNKLNARALDQQRNTFLFQMNKTYEQKSNQMANFANSGLAADRVNAAADHIELRNMIKNAFDKGYISPERATIMTKNLDREFYMNDAEGQYRNSRTPEQKKSFLKQFKNSKEYNTHLGPDQKRILMNRFSAIDKEHAAENGFTDANYNSKVNELKYNTLHGIPINTNTLSDLAKVKPTKFNTLVDELKTNQEIYSRYSVFKNAKIAEMKAAKAAIDNEEPKSYKESIMGKKVSQMLGAQIERAEKDPAGVAYENPAFKSVLENKEKMKGITPRMAMISFLKHQGYTDHQMNVLTNPEAFEAVARIKGLPLDKQMDMLSSILEPMNLTVRYYAARDLQRAGLPKATQYLLRINKSDDQRIKNLEEDAAIAFSKPISEYTDVLEKAGTSPSKLKQRVYKDNNFNAYFNALTSSNGDHTDEIADRAKHQMLLAARLLEKPGYNIDSAVSTAGQMLDTGTSFGSFRDGSYVYDKRIPSGRINTAVRYLLDEAHQQRMDLAIPPHAYPRLAHIFPQDISRYSGLFLYNCYPINTSDQRGIVLVDHFGSVLRTKSGKAFTVTFKDLLDPSAEFSTKLDKFSIEREQKFHERYRMADVLSHDISNVRIKDLNTTKPLSVLLKNFQRYSGEIL